MIEETYSILDAIKEEAQLLEELEKTYEEEKAWLLRNNARDIRRSLERIVDRFDNGKEYYLGIHEGKPRIKRRQTDKHLLREYPSLRSAKENYDTVKHLVK